MASNSIINTRSRRLLGGKNRDSTEGRLVSSKTEEMLVTIGYGICGVIVTVAMHAGCTTFVFWLMRACSEPVMHRFPRMGRPVFLGLVAGILATKHSLDCILWAVAYWFLTAHDQLESFEETVYFSFVTYTALGYGDIVLLGPVRLWCGIEAMNGILLFGWSTALLFVLVDRLWITTNWRKPGS